jgi:hypothetical protein
MAVNPLISSPQITLTQAANQNVGQMANASDTKSATKASQNQTTGFNANVGKQNTELQNPKINQDTKTTDIKTPNTSQEANNSIKGAQVPKISTEGGEPTIGKKSGNGTSLDTMTGTETPASQADGLSDSGINAGFNGYLKQKASDYMSNKTKESMSNQSSTDTSGPKENSTPGNYKPNTVNSAPQRPEAQNARANAAAPSAAATPNIPSYNRPVSQPPVVPKIPKPMTPSFKKPF